MCVNMKFASKFKRIVPIGEVRIDPKLKGIPLTFPGQRLSVMPISKAHYERIVELSNK
jgi:predicted RNA-binding protein with PUA-like domain